MDKINCFNEALEYIKVTLDNNEELKNKIYNIVSERTFNMLSFEDSTEQYIVKIILDIFINLGKSECH
jgi:hypothetical protein